MQRIGLVLGGGGVTGASYELAALMAIQMATGWDPNDADVVVGTSAGSYVASLVRNGRLDLDTLVRPGDGREEVAERIRSHLFRRETKVKLGRWARHGLLPGLMRPGITLAMGTPARFDASGLADWVELQVGESAYGWPEKATVVVAYDVASRDRVAFGTTDAPDVGLAEAVAASSAIPLVFNPYEIDGRMYVDGGVASGTHADLVLGAEAPLDLVIVIAPMAAEDGRRGQWPHEKLFDHVGRNALDREIELIRSKWSETEVLVLTPAPAVLQSMRPNPMASDRAVPTFIRTLASMKKKLAEPAVWSVLSEHLIRSSQRSAS